MLRSIHSPPTYQDVVIQEKTRCSVNSTHQVCSLSHNTCLSF